MATCCGFGDLHSLGFQSASLLNKLHKLCTAQAAARLHGLSAHLLSLGSICVYSDCTRALYAVEQARREQARPEKKMLRAWRYDAEEQWHQSRSPLENVLAEGFELLRWSVLAASTIGPGTVIVCSKAGYQYAYRLSLIHI